MRAEDETTRPGAPPSAAPAAAGTFVFRARTRRWGTVAIVVTVGVATGLSTMAADDRESYILAHALAAAPFLLVALSAGVVVKRWSPAEFGDHWRSWVAANLLGALACISAIGGVLLESDALLALDVMFLTAAVPFWTAAGLVILRALAGRRDATVDMVDSTMALVVLSAPGVLLLTGPVLGSGDLLFAVPFAVFLALMPAGVYGAILNLTRVPRDERIPLALGLGIAVTFSLNMALQLTKIMGDPNLPTALFVGMHAVNMGFVAVLPLWAHRVSSGGLARLPVARQVRRVNPMPTISAVVLPLLALYVLALRPEDRWAVGYLAVVLLVVIVLNALRHAMLSREAQRLSGELAGMAEERRLLLANMVRALDDDRRRTVSELHTQAVGSLSTLGTVVQTACVSLPPATATVVRETIAQLQGDLTTRAEELRLLMVAMRPPTFGRNGSRSPSPMTSSGQRSPSTGAPGTAASAGAGGGGALHGEAADDALTAALRAYAADLLDERTTGAHPAVHIDVDPRLDLDRSTMTIVYRIAQDAVLNAVRHAAAGHVSVAVTAEADSGAIVVEVTDDGVGFDPGTVVEGSGLSSIRLFTDLGRGEVSLRSAPGEGTTVRCLLGVRDTAARVHAAAAHADAAGAIAGPGDNGAGPDDGPAATAMRAGRRHLRLITRADVSPRAT